MNDPNMSWEDAINQLRESVNKLIDLQQESYDKFFIQEAAQYESPNAALVTQMGGYSPRRPSKTVSRVTLDERIQQLQDRLRRANNPESNDPNG